jgi:hypothetical protein
MSGRGVSLLVFVMVPADGCIVIERSQPHLV